MEQDSFLLEFVDMYEHPAYVDEVGLGAAFGDLVACAVIIPKNFNTSLVDDSKKLKHSLIYKLAPVLKQYVTCWSIGVVTIEELKKLRNMYQGDQLAMKRALRGLKIKPDAVFADGKHALDVDIPCHPVIKGDGRLAGCAAASIIAKEFRDKNVVRRFGKEFEKYEISKNKGYFSPAHKMAVRKFGITEFHRDWMPQVQDVVSGRYDRVIKKKYAKQWAGV